MSAPDVVQIGPVTLIHGDAQEVLADYRGAADLLCTDHPYRLTSGGRGQTDGKTMTGIFDPEDYDNSGDLMVMAEWNRTGGPIYRALKPDADAYVMVNDKNLMLAAGAFLGAGFKFHNLLVWDKHGPTPNRWYMKHLEFVLYLWKGKGRPIRNLGSKQLFRADRPGLGNHKTEKPVALMRHYIENSSEPGDVVLDPYMGSGTTLVAAIEAGRAGLGIEIEREHFDTACRRVREALT
ncbi:DNA-methyltransferase [Pacificoceanicola onchidii]|uniref:DNA-methyltransferase n=1 Tax=Pacificoceanicola onchidii TaxID=2562685 RepID=UPI0010A37FEB|nr:site-specific DNA-methyltransferase [Pacificoceanicola onchidii]